jgi:hypothetical protein
MFTVEFAPFLPLIQMELSFVKEILQVIFGEHTIINQLVYQILIKIQHA